MDFAKLLNTRPIDPTDYIVIFVLVTLALVMLSSWNSNLAMGLAFTILFAIAINVTGTKPAVGEKAS